MKWTLKAVKAEAEKYISRTEFSRGSGSAYFAARKKGWLDDVCSHMTSRFVWNIESVKLEAVKYETRIEFIKKSNGAYNAALKKGWLDQVCTHMQKPVIWTVEAVEAEAKKYVTRNEFKNGSVGAWDYARRNGCLDDVCCHMAKLKREKWTFWDCKKEALKYETRTEFSKGASGAYGAAKHNGWLDDLCLHMVILWEKKWTFEAVNIEAKKYKTRNDLRKNSGGAYGAAHRNGWLEKVSAHMVNGKLKWTFENLKIEARKYSSRLEFSKGSGGAYKTACDNAWIDAVCRHMAINYNGYYHCAYVVLNRRLNKAYVGITSQKFELRMIQHKLDNNPCNSKSISQLSDTVFIQLTDYIYTAEQVKEFAEQQYVNEYISNGFELLNDERSIGAVGYSKRKWTVEKCKEEALRYRTRWEFQQESANAYSAAKNHGWLDEICDHMTEAIKPSDYWTIANCKKIALKYKTREELRRKSSYVHKIIYINGWADEVCAHMERVKLKPWEKTNANKELWLKAAEIYSLWMKNNQCSGFVLSKIYELAGHALNSIIQNFKSDWIPEQDQDWLDWHESMFINNSM